METAATRLSRRLAGVIGQRDAREWIEDCALALLGAAGQSGPPVRLSHAMETAARAKWDFVPQLGVRARLTFEDGHWQIWVSEALKNTPWWRLSVSHEIGHTLLYDSIGSTPQPLIRVQPGDRDVEWLCNLFSRALLAPGSWVSAAVSDSPRPGNPEFSLQQLTKLASQFGLPESVVARRLAEDLNEWSCVILSFARPRGPGTDDAPADWRLVWSARPRESELFIPRGKNLGDAGTLHPRAHGPIGSWLGSIATSENRYVSGTVDPLVLRSSSTGNLSAIVRRAGAASTKFYAWIPGADADAGQESLRLAEPSYPSSDRTTTSERVVVAIPLEA